MITCYRFSVSENPNTYANAPETRKPVFTTARSAFTWSRGKNRKKEKDDRIDSNVLEPVHEYVRPVSLELARLSPRPVDRFSRGGPLQQSGVRL